MPDFAHVAGIESRAGPTAVLAHGIDDALVTAGGATMFLVRFEAQGDVPDESALQWDFGDGTKGTGRNARHVYFKPGDYEVSLASGGSKVAPFWNSDAIFRPIRQTPVF